LAVLITGGFHAPGIVERFTSNGIRTIAVVPKGSGQDQGDGDARYRAVMKYKNHQGSFEEVMALAEQPAQSVDAPTAIAQAKADNSEQNAREHP
jgi:esterase/lipase